MQQRLIRRTGHTPLIAWLFIVVSLSVTIAVTVFLFRTEFPPDALYGALQAAVFDLGLSMGLSAMCKSEAAGVLLTINPR